MIPLFTTDYSIGKSILKFKGTSPEGGPDSVVDICKEHQIKHAFLVEEKMHGFLDYLRYSESNDFKFTFGLKIYVASDVEPKDTHKVIVFAKNDNGVRSLYKIYSHIFCETGGFARLEDLKLFWNNDLLMAIPYYDSFVYYNNFTFKKFVLDLGSFGDITMFIEENGLPFEKELTEKVKKWASDNNYKTEKVKSIYYKNKKDFAAYQVRKIIDRRKGGRGSSLGNPNLDGCGSDEFCIESWLEHEARANKIG